MRREEVSRIANASTCCERAQPWRDAPRENTGVRCASLTAAVVPQIDHRVGKRLQRVVYLTDALEAKQQTPKLVFLGEHALVSAKALLEDGRIEVPLTASLWCFTATPVFGNIGTHVQVENKLTIGPAVVDAVQAHR